jgi:hypothetical protein
MKTGVQNDPDNRESGKAGHESFLGELPNTAEFLFVDTLKSSKVNVQYTGVQRYKQDQPQSSLKNINMVNDQGDCSRSNAGQT